MLYCRLTQVPFNSSSIYGSLKYLIYQHQSFLFHQIFNKSINIKASYLIFLSYLLKVSYFTNIKAIIKNFPFYNQGDKPTYFLLPSLWNKYNFDTIHQ